MSGLWDKLISGVGTILGYKGGTNRNESAEEIARLTNLQNANQFNQQMGFNAEQAEIARQFSAQQASQQRGWSSKEASIARLFNKEEANSARTFNSTEALLGRNFLERMSNTQHQRATADLRKAGLNPILAAGGGNVVSSSPSASGSAAQSGIPSGAQANSTAASMSGAGNQQQHQIVDPIASAINSGSSLYSTLKKGKKLDAETRNAIETLHKIMEDTNVSNQQAQYLIANAEKLRAETDKATAQTDGITSENVAKRIEADFFQSFEFVKLAKTMGINQNTLKSIYRLLLKIIK